MNKSKTLREVCEEFEISRRAIQGYEKAGLISASGKNKYGHLLYDDMVQKRILEIRLYQQIGLTLKEIGTLIDAPDSIKKNGLERQIQILKGNQQQISHVIEQIQEIIAKLDK